jgi:hypothetical protein
MQPQADKEKQIHEAAKLSVQTRYNSITDSDITELSSIGESLLSDSFTPTKEQIQSLVFLANRAILENNKIKEDMIVWTAAKLENAVALQSVVNSLSIEKPRASLARAN